MKIYFGLLCSLIGLLGTSVFATYDDFSNQLKTMGVDVATIESQASISRYDMARLLNSVECKDCIHPNKETLTTYGQNFWSTFTKLPNKDFNDIQFLGATYNNASYYYCVAYVGDNTYMRGYPKATSPICGGKFCGTQKATTAEFIQVVINILAKYVYKDLQLNRKEVNTRITKQKTESYEAKNFTSDDKKTIAEKSKTCDNICTLQTTNEVNLYLKYCMFNITKCSMQEIGKIKQGYWPIAELNLLYRQNIIDIDQSQRNNIDKNIDGKTVLETLFKLNGKVSCAFNNDYDCDGIENPKDSCPNTYNPSQKDTDRDGIGDVCDDDIDNDTIKNPIGIVDEEGKIDISKWTKNIDNCLFVVNTDQQDTSKSSIGDACKNNDGQIGLYIDINKLEGTAPLTTTFTAVSEGNIQSITRDFGDGTQGSGKILTHTFTNPGMYTIQSTAQGEKNSAKAQIILIVGGQTETINDIQARTSSIGGDKNTESTLSTIHEGNFDQIERIFPKENTSVKKGPNESFKKTFINEGENPVIVKGYSKGLLLGISYFTIGIADGKGAILKSNLSNPQINQKILFDTKTYNITQDDILKVDRDLGDGNKKSNTTLTMEYTYTKAGKKAVTQTITLTNGKKLTNACTIYISDSTTLASYALVMKPSTLIANIGQKIDFSTSIIGTLLKTPLVQLVEFGDKITQKKIGTIKLPNVFIHSYQNNGMLTPENSIYINQCTYLHNQATIAIKGSDSCLEAKIQGTLKNYRCDMDKDGIPDLCDTDIDGDGIQNLLGLLLFEKKDCSYSNENLNQELLTKHYQSVCSLDNAPFDSNPDQLDLNQDGVGDSQSNKDIIGSGEMIDSDGDGIADNQDLCPTIQETRNGITDEDGCPEVGQDLGCTQQGIGPLLAITNDNLIVKPTECNQCPCQFSDYASDLANNDQVRAILRDKKKTTQYRTSLPWIIEF